MENKTETENDIENDSFNLYQVTVSIIVMEGV